MRVRIEPSLIICAAKCILIYSLSCSQKGVENPVFLKENTDMLLGDAKVMCEKLAAGVKAHLGK